MSGDVCGECGELIDPTRRPYRGPGGKPRCSVCAVLAELNLELVRVTTLAELLTDMESKGPVH